MATKTHWKKLTNPDYLGSYSLEDGKDITLTVDTVRTESIIGADGKKEDCVVCYWAERDAKPMILNATNLKMLQKLTKSPFIEDWRGTRVSIGSERVKAFGEIVDALRIRKQLPSSAVIPCETCGQVITGASGMTAEQVAAYTFKMYGKKLCTECGKKAKESKANAAEQQ